MNSYYCYEDKSYDYVCDELYVTTYLVSLGGEAKSEDLEVVCWDSSVYFD